MTNDELIRQKLSQIGYEYDSFQENDKIYLGRLEGVISEIFKREEEANRLLVNNQINIHNVSFLAKISRETIYKRKILREYIELRNRDFKYLDSSKSTAEMESIIIQLNKRIEAMEYRDYVIEEQKKEIENLVNKLRDKEQEIVRLRNSRISNDN